jgi:hypothetical protein
MMAASFDHEIPSWRVPGAWPKVTFSLGRKSPPGGVGNAVKAPSREDRDIGPGRVVLIFAAHAEVAHCERIKRAGPVMPIVTLARARTKSPTQSGIDALRERVRQEAVPEEL